MTASKDGSLYVWKILTGAEHADEDRLSYVADVSIDEPVSKAKWLSDKIIIMTTTYGSVYSVSLTLDDQQVECLSRPKKIFESEHEVAIWDLAVMNMADKVEAWIAEDSGKVTQLCFDRSIIESNEMTVSSSKTVHVSANKFITLCFTFSAIFQRICFECVTGHSSHPRLRLVDHCAHNWIKLKGNHTRKTFILARAS